MMFYRPTIYSCPVSLLENVMAVNSITYLYKYSEDAAVTGNKKLLVFIWEIFSYDYLHSDETRVKLWRMLLEK